MRLRRRGRYDPRATQACHGASARQSTVAGWWTALALAAGCVQKRMHAVVLNCRIDAALICTHTRKELSGCPVQVFGVDVSTPANDVRSGAPQQSRELRDCSRRCSVCLHRCDGRSLRAGAVCRSSVPPRRDARTRIRERRRDGANVPRERARIHSTRLFDRSCPVTHRPPRSPPVRSPRPQRPRDRHGSRPIGIHLASTRA